MKRDLELVRSILLRIEEHEEPGTVPMAFEGFSEQQVMYNAKLLLEEEMILGYDSSPVGGYSVEPTRLTWKGHDFLADAKNESVWQKSLQIVKEKGGSISFEAFKALLAAVAKEAVTKQFS